MALSWPWLMAQTQPGWAGKAEPGAGWDSHRGCWELPPFCHQLFVVPAAQPSFQTEERITKACRCFSIYSVICRNAIASILRTESSHFYQYRKNQFAACNQVHLLNTAAFPPNLYAAFYEKSSFSFSFKPET